MRKLFIALALTATLAAAATETGDTLVIKDAHRVSIMTSDSLQRIEVRGKEYDQNYVYENTIRLVDDNYVNEQRAYRDLSAIDFPISQADSCHGATVYGTMHFGMGCGLGMGADAGFGLKPFSSFEGMWTILQLEYSPWRTLQTYSLGLTLDWRFYRFDTRRSLVKNAGGRAVAGDFPQGAENTWTGLTTMSLSVPLLFRQRFSRTSRWAFSVGPVFNFNVYGVLDNRYTIGDSDYTVTTHDVGYRPFTVDLMGILHYRYFGLYVKYSPMSAFKSGCGPKYQLLTLGLYL